MCRSAVMSEIDGGRFLLPEAHPGIIAFKLGADAYSREAKSEGCFPSTFWPCIEGFLFHVKPSERHVLITHGIFICEVFLLGLRFKSFMWKVDQFVVCVVVYERCPGFVVGDVKNAAFFQDFLIKQNKGGPRSSR